jgi:glycosyltransferase involved in cell wall biosynthesis
MPIIGLDATHLCVNGKGLSRYQYNLIKGLARLDKKNCYYVFLNKKNPLPEFPKQDNFHYVRIYIPNRIIWDQFQLPIFSMAYRLDIYHSSIETLPFFGKGKFVLYLFEIPHRRIKLLEHKSSNSLYAQLSHWYNKILFRPSLRRARIIMVSSENTKKDLIQGYNVEEKKIRVLYPAPDEYFCFRGDDTVSLDIRKRYNADTGYILHFSSSDPRDNTQAVIRAYHKALFDLAIPKKLIIAGNAKPEESGLSTLIKELRLENNIIFTGHLPLFSKELVALYQSADLYIDPTLYEGFGLQAVEAMACGIPVITSNVASLPEVVGDAGIMVDPNDINGLAKALVRVLNDSGVRQALCQKSLKRAKFFSWDRLAQNTLDIYNELILQSDG